MADYKAIFQTVEHQNWAKSIYAIQVARLGLLDICKYVTGSFHINILKSLPNGATCSSCKIEDVIPYSQRGHGCQYTCRCPSSPCVKGVCDKIRNLIEKEHRYNKISWKNTNLADWCLCPWEIAKCYFPEVGYKDKTSAEEADFNAIVSLIKNCRLFEQISSLQNFENVCDKARDLVNYVHHCADIKMTHKETDDVIVALTDLLNDRCLDSYQTSVEARANLAKLKNDTLCITNKELQTLLQEACNQIQKDLKDSVDKFGANTQELQTKLENLEHYLTLVTELQKKVNDQDQKNDERFGRLEEKVTSLDETVTHLKQSPEVTVTTYNEFKRDLQTDLVKFYTVKKSTVLISQAYPDLDEKLERFYVQQKLTVVQVRKDINASKDIKGKAILTYKELFEIGNLTNIYIQGNPGMGKSTYGTKLTLDWCKYIISRGSVQNKEADTSIERLDFDFLFLISLREGNDNACGVLEMVKEAVISHLSFEQKYNDEFLSKVLDRERCLIILDGLDEWTHPQNGSCRKSPKHIPHRSALGECVYLTLSRPWKLSQICLKDSEIDVLLEISGVREQNELVIKVIESLNRNTEVSRDVNKFNTASEHLSDLKTIPIIAIQLICVWHESEKIPSSQSGIYFEMMKMMLDRKKNDEVSSKPNLTVDMTKCFRCMKWFGSEKHILENLGKLAFETLFPEDRHSSHVVFNRDTVSQYLEQEMKTTALSVGLLTEYKIRSLNQKRSQLSFLHKTFQEFLAAFYLSQNADQNKELVSRVKIQGENINDISQLFTFLCAMAPTLATAVSKVLMEVTTRSLKNRQYDSISKALAEGEYFDDFYKNIVKNVQEIINTGYTECVQNGHENVCLEMFHIYLDSKDDKVCQPEEKLLQQNVKKIETIWCEHPDFYQKALIILNSSSVNITTLCLPYVDNSVDLKMCRCLQAFTILISEDNKSRPAVFLDMSRCKLLEHLYITQGNLALNINTDQLQYCRLWWCDLSQGNIVKTVTKRNSKLRYLFLVGCRFPGVDSGDRSLHLDLTSCSTLKVLGISHCDISVSINTTNLQECYLWDIDLSQGNLLETLNNSTQLTRLRLERCCFEKKKRRQNKVCIDISACTNLSLIKVEDSDVIMKYDSFFVGTDQTLWEKYE